MTDFEALLRLLVEHDVAFIIVGGAAAIIHGSSRLTQDLDLVYERTPENIARLVAARVKRAAGRPRDLEAIAELEAMQREQLDPDAID
jgi:hypothetical protein